MAVGFTVEVTGSKELIDGLKKLSNGIMNLDTEFAIVGAYLINFEQDTVFETEGQEFNSPWAQLSIPYKYAKARQYPNRPILERTGNMRRGFMFTILNSHEALFHNQYDDQYLKFHQKGTSKMPKRVLYKLDDQRKNFIREIFTKGIKTKLEQAFHG